MWTGFASTTSRRARVRWWYCCNGLPEFWYSWRRQIPFLVEAGYRVIAPDMRGYNLSSKPAGWRQY